MPSTYYPLLPELEANKRYEAVLSGDEFHHLVRVSRHKAGDSVLLNSGRGVLASAVIDAIGRNEAHMRITDYSRLDPIPAPFSIAFSLLKSHRDENIVEKCTELGVSEFFPMTVDYGVRRTAQGTLERFRKVALAAIKQCDNPFLPAFNPIFDLPTTLKAIKDKGYTPVVCSERRPDVWVDGAELACDSHPCFIIGPEGGFSESEFNIAASHGAKELSVGYLITRADTAAISIAAQWLGYANMARTGGTT